MALSLNMFQLTDSEIVYLHSPASIMSHFRYRQWEKARALYWTLLNLTLRCCWAQFTGLASGIWLYCHQFWSSVHSILQNFWSLYIKHWHTVHILGKMYTAHHKKMGSKMITINVYFVLQVCSTHIWFIFLLKFIEEKNAYHPTSQSVWMIANIQKI